MKRTAACLAVLLLVLGAGISVHAASQKALDLRKDNALVPYTPPDAFLAGYFLAEEMEPAFMFGTVKDFAAGRTCPVTWLIEEGEKARIAKPADPAAPPEYTLYMEEDCPDAVAYYVFVDQSAMTPKQWIEWRRQFHKNKAEGEYGAVRDKLEKAVTDGMRMGGELRFILKNGDLAGGTSPQTTLMTSLGFQPCYDLKQGAKLSR